MQKKTGWIRVLNKYGKVESYYYYRRGAWIAWVERTGIGSHPWRSFLRYDNVSLDIGVSKTLRQAKRHVLSER